MSTITNEYQKALKLAESEKCHGKEVLSLLERAHSLGDHRASYAFSEWLYKGVEGVIEKDIERSFKILKSVGDSNVAEISYKLGYFYEYEPVSVRNGFVAFGYFTRSGLLGFCPACEEVANYYLVGDVVQKNVRAGSAWLERSQQNERDISSPSRIWLTDRLE